MGALLLLGLSLFFAAIFTLHYKQKIAELTSQLSEATKQNQLELAHKNTQIKLLQNTVRELLQDIRES